MIKNRGTDGAQDNGFRLNAKFASRFGQWFAVLLDRDAADGSFNDTKGIPARARNGFQNAPGLVHHFRTDSVTRKKSDLGFHTACACSTSAFRSESSTTF